MVQQGFMLLWSLCLLRVKSITSYKQILYSSDVKRPVAYSVTATRRKRKRKKNTWPLPPLPCHNGFAIVSPLELVEEGEVALDVEALFLCYKVLPCVINNRTLGLTFPFILCTTSTWQKGYSVSFGNMLNMVLNIYLPIKYISFHMNIHHTGSMTFI